MVREEELKNIKKFVIAGKSIRTLKELLINKFNTNYFYKKVYSNKFSVKDGELFIFVFEHFDWLIGQTLSATVICEFIKNQCDVTIITTGGKSGWLKISWWSEEDLSGKISEYLKNISNENNWRFDKITLKQ